MSDLPANPILYRIDADNRICDVDGPWDHFAQDNDGEGLTIKRVLGQPLWAHIVGSTTRMLYQSIFRHVRGSGHTIAFTYRCDSPDIRRFMHMSVEPRDNNEIQFRSELVRIEPRQVPLNIKASLADKPPITRCSLCNFLRVRGKWTDVQDAVATGLVFDHDIPVMVAYSVCPRCVAEISSSGPVGRQGLI